MTHSFFLSLVLKKQINYLGPKSLPRTVAHLLMLVDPPVENTVYVLWAGLHPRAIQSQQERHDSFICVTCLTYAYLWHASFISRLISRWYEWVFVTMSRPRTHTGRCLPCRLRSQTYLQDGVNVAPAAHTFKSNLALPEAAIAYQPCLHKVYL